MLSYAQQVKAFIYCSGGTGFICGNNMTDIRDNRVYPTVQIGSQVLDGLNLNFGTILHRHQDQRDNCVSEKYCYNDNQLTVWAREGMYQWDELCYMIILLLIRAFCPPTWQYSNWNDWTHYFANYINNGFAGSPLKYSVISFMHYYRSKTYWQKLDFSRLCSLLMVIDS